MAPMPNDATSGADVAGIVTRQRRSEKYWEDYEDWKKHHPCAIECFERFVAAASGKLLTVFLDYDGTISPIVKQPERAFMSDEMRAAVRRVAALYPTAVISGRSREKVYDFVQIPELYYAGSHGLDIVGPRGIASRRRRARGAEDGDAASTDVHVSASGVGEDEDDDAAPTHEAMHQPAPWAAELMDEVNDRCVKAIEDIPGATVDHNKFCISVHYRNCDPKHWGEVEAVVDACVASDPTRLKKATGRKVFEVKPRVAWDKGKALSFLLGELGLDERFHEDEVLSLYFGDDHTDEDAFNELKGMPNGRGCGVIVSTVPKPSDASFSVRDPDDVLIFLNRIADLAENGTTKSMRTTDTAGVKRGGGAA